MYASDHDERLVYAMTLGPGTTQTWWWGVYDPVSQALYEDRGPLYPYTRSKGIQKCPMFDNALRGKVGFTGYGYNYLYLGYTQSVGYNEIGNVAETVAFGTSARINNWDYSIPTLQGNPYLDPPSQNYPGFQGRFNGSGVILWADGHTKTRKPTMRSGTFGYGFQSADFLRHTLGDIDQDGDTTTDELFDLN